MEFPFNLPPSLPLSPPVTEDYGALPSTSLLFDDITTEQSVAVTIVNDSRAEPTENFIGQLSLLGLDTGRVSISPSQTTVTIADDDREGFI